MMKRTYCLFEFVSSRAELFFCIYSISVLKVSGRFPHFNHCCNSSAESKYWHAYFRGLFLLNLKLFLPGGARGLRINNIVHKSSSKFLIKQ